MRPLPYYLPTYKRANLYIGFPIIGSVLILIGSFVKASPVLLSPPPPVAIQGWPSLQTKRICAPLQRSFQNLLGKSSWAWSVSVVDNHGYLLADINGSVPKVPASNQKLITTAFALDKLGADFKLSTRLIQRDDGVLEISGEGDPDLGTSEIQRFALAAFGQSGSGLGRPYTDLKLMIREEPRQHWWPSDWHPTDRMYAYGAPITRLALTSNALDVAINNPIERLKRLLEREMLRQGSKAQLMIVNHDQGNEILPKSNLLHKKDSAPIHALVSLANSESHNFTAEVLLRHAAENWDVKVASLRTLRWMQSQNLPLKGLRIADGSGLSRNNRVSSQTLATLLMRMGHHPLGPYYQASMAIAGQRGTLRMLYKDSTLEGKFWGKTGTLNGVRSISGILETSDGPRYVSAIANGASFPDTTIGLLLKETQRFSPCS